MNLSLSIPESEGVSSARLADFVGNVTDYYAVFTSCASVHNDRALLQEAWLN